MSEDPIFDPWALGEESRPTRSQRSSRWRSAASPARGLPLATPTTGTARRPPPPATGRAFSLRTPPPATGPASYAGSLRPAAHDVDEISIEGPGRDRTVPAPAIFSARPFAAAEPAPVSDLRQNGIAASAPGVATVSRISRSPLAAAPTSSPSVEEGHEEVAAEEPATVQLGRAAHEPHWAEPSVEPVDPGAPWSLREARAGWSRPGPRAAPAHAHHGIDEAIASLDALLKPRVERASQRLRVSRHGTDVDDRLDQRPPSLRLHLRRWVAPLQGPRKRGAAILEIELEGLRGETVTGRYWLDRRSLSPTVQRSVPIDGLTPGWLDELLLEFVDKALVR